MSVLAGSVARRRRRRRKAVDRAPRSANPPCARVHLLRSTPASCASWPRPLAAACCNVIGLGGGGGNFVFLSAWRAHGPSRALLTTPALVLVGAAGVGRLGRALLEVGVQRKAEHYCLATNAMLLLAERARALAARPCDFARAPTLLRRCWIDSWACNDPARRGVQPPDGAAL